MRDTRRAFEVIGGLAVSVGALGALGKWAAAGPKTDLWSSYTFDALVALAGVGAAMFLLGVLDLVPRSLSLRPALRKGKELAWYANEYLHGRRPTVPTPEEFAEGMRAWGETLMQKHGVPVKESAFPVLFQCEGFEQNDEFSPRNTQIKLHLRAVNRTTSNASLVLHLGIADPQQGFRLWQQARTPGAHPLAVLTPQGREDPSHVPAEHSVKLEPEFLFAQEYVEDLRTQRFRGAKSSLGMVDLDHLWLRAKDLISGQTVERQLADLDEL